MQGLPRSSMSTVLWLIIFEILSLSPVALKPIWGFHRIHTLIPALVKFTSLMFLETSKGILIWRQSPTEAKHMLLSEVKLSSPEAEGFTVIMINSNNRNNSNNSINSNNSSNNY